MIINWYGEGCFKIQVGGLTLLTDPFSAKGGSASGGESSIGNGLTPPRGKNDITLKTLTAWPLLEEESKEEKLIQGAGEYEIQGMTIRGFSLPEESSEKFIKTAYKAAMEDFTLGFLGHISDDLPAEALEELKNADILFAPAGGKPFLGQEATAKLIKQLNPKIVIASFFKVPGLKRPSGDWKALANEMNQKPEVLEKLTIRKKEIAEQKGTKLVVLRV